MKYLLAALLLVLASCSAADRQAFTDYSTAEVKLRSLEAQQVELEKQGADTALIAQQVAAAQADRDEKLAEMRRRQEEAESRGFSKVEQALGGSAGLATVGYLINLWRDRRNGYSVKKAPA